MPELAAEGETPECPRDTQWRGQEERVDEAKPGYRLPEREQDGEDEPGMELPRLRQEAAAPEGHLARGAADCRALGPTPDLRHRSSPARRSRLRRGSATRGARRARRVRPAPPCRCARAAVVRSRPLRGCDRAAATARQCGRQAAAPRRNYG